MANDDLQQRLERALAERLDPDLRIVELDRNTEGYSQETFSVEASVGSGAHRERRGYVIKREPEAGLLEPYDLEPEFRVLNALSGHPLLSPPTPVFEADPAVLERPFYVMEKLPGDVPVPAARPDGTGPLSDGERTSLGPQVALSLAELHRIDWRKLGFDFLGVPDSGAGAATRELARWTTRLERAGYEPAPILVESLQWLHANRPATDEIALVHGDYRLGNFLVESDGQTARLSGILDWEMVHLGDPLEDLAWCISPLWRGGTEFAGAMLPPGEFVAAYESASGRRADPERLHFYALLAVVKMLAIMLTGIRAFEDGRTRDLRMATFDHQIPFLHALLAVTRGWLPGG